MLHTNIEVYLSSFSCVFLASSIIKYAGNDEERNIFRHKLNLGLSRSLNKKNLKRLVINHISSCNYESLALKSGLFLKIYLKPIDYLEAPYSVLLLLPCFETLTPIFGRV